MKLFVLFLFIAAGAGFQKLYSTDYTNTVLTEKIRIRNYQVVRYTVTSAAGRQRLITREIGTDRGVKYYFIDTATLGYGLTDRLDGVRSDGGPSPDSFLGKVLARQNSSGRPFGSAMEFHAGPSNKNIVLTSDLCPTGNNYDSQFYSNLVSLKRDHGTAVPLVIFFSGRWLNNHASQLAAIKNTGLDFIAGNHTYSHTILNAKNNDVSQFTAELTNTEKTMFENGVLPSFFFRFPGLVYNKSHMDALDRLTMTAVNANVWMGTRARNWGILLVHSNGCASSEVRVFASFTARNLKRIKSGDLRFHSIYAYLRETTGVTN